MPVLYGWAVLWELAEIFWWVLGLHRKEKTLSITTWLNFISPFHLLYVFVLVNYEPENGCLIMNDELIILLFNKLTFHITQQTTTRSWLIVKWLTCCDSACHASHSCCSLCAPASQKVTCNNYLMASWKQIETHYVCAIRYTMIILRITSAAYIQNVNYKSVHHTKCM